MTTPETSANQQQSESGSHQAQVADDLQKIIEGRQLEAVSSVGGQAIEGEVNQLEPRERVQKVWGKYASYGEGYDRHQAERLTHGGMETDTYLDGSLKVIASVNSEKFEPRTGKPAKDVTRYGLMEGKWADGHDYAPDSFNNRYIAEQFRQFVMGQGVENVVLIYEGYPDESGSWSEAVQKRTESGGLQFLARQMGVEAVPGEPLNINEITAAEFENQGLAREVTALAFALRALQARPEYSFGGSGNSEEAKQPVGDVLLDIYPQLAAVGLSDKYPLFSEDDKKYFTQDIPEAQSDFLMIRQDILTKLEPAIAQMNAWLESMQIPSRLEVDTLNGELKFIPPLMLFELSADPHDESQLGKFWAEQGAIRDRELSTAVAAQVARGKKVFIAYGGSHIMSTKDIFTDLYGQPNVEYPRDGKYRAGDR
ncbi:hypothetical protein IPM44_03065 [bacterium]|nr:MAG: hypothetical protein IPM44_03065 [bacterium]